MKWRFREAERKQSECESECETSDHTRSVFSILTPTLTLLLVVVATLLLSSEAFFDQRSFSEVGGEGGITRTHTHTFFVLESSGLGV
jgi:hypothetical protein